MKEGGLAGTKGLGLPASLLSSFHTLLAGMRHIKEKIGGVEGAGRGRNLVTLVRVA